MSSGSGGLELSVDNVVKAFIDAGVVWTKEECKSVFDIPEEWIDAVANFYPTNEERLRISVQFWLSVDPSPSWKRVIALMDYWIDKPSAASKMYQYAESATGNCPYWWDIYEVTLYWVGKTCSDMLKQHTSSWAT